MTVHGCPSCRLALAFRPGFRIDGFAEGDWAGCPGCGRNVCAPCAETAGQRCAICGAALVANQLFARWVRPQGHWRDALEDRPDAVQLIAHASADVVDTLLAAATAQHPAFADDVARLVARHALGGLEHVVYLFDTREHRLPAAWFTNLERLARRLSARAPDRWAATVDGLTLVRGLASLAPDRLPLPWPADLLRDDHPVVRTEAGELLDRVALPYVSARDEPIPPRAELDARLADRDQHPWHRTWVIDDLATLAPADAAARARLLALIDDGQELVDVRVHAAVALAVAAPGDAPPAARLAEAAAPILRAAGHVLGARARADDPCLLLRYLASSSDAPLTAWCAAHPDEVAARRTRAGQARR